MSKFENAEKVGEFTQAPEKGDMDSTVMAENTVEATKNLIENGIGAGVQNGVEEFTVEVIPFEDELFVVDTAGGVPESDPRNVVKYASSGSDEESTSPFAFGVGAPSAKNRLADEMTVYTQGQDADVVGSTEVGSSDEWANLAVMEFDSWGDVPERVREFSSVEFGSGMTVLHFEGLRCDVMSKVDEIRDEVQMAFHRFIDASYSSTVDASVVVDGNEIESVGDVSRVQSIVGLEPRRWVGIELSGDENVELVETVDCEVEVSLVDDVSDAGMWVYCNDMCLYGGRSGPKSGFGRGRQFGSVYDSVRVVVDLKTETDPQKLPWNKQKSGIVKNPILEEAYDWVGRVGEAYFRAVRKRGVEHLVGAFEAEGVVETVDHSGRSTVHPTANVKADEVSKSLERVDEMLKAQARLMVISPEIIRECVDVPSSVGEREFVEMCETVVYQIAESESVGYWNTTAGENLEIDDVSFEFVEEIPSFVFDECEVIGEVIHHRGFVDSATDTELDVESWAEPLYDWCKNKKYADASNKHTQDVITSDVGRDILVHSHFAVKCFEDVAMQAEDAYEWCLSHLVSSSKVRGKFDGDVSLDDCISVSSVDVSASEVWSVSKDVTRKARKDSMKPQYRVIEDGSEYEQHLYDVVISSLADVDISQLPSRAEVQAKSTQTSSETSPRVADGNSEDSNKTASNTEDAWDGASANLLSQVSRLLNTISKTLYPSSGGEYNDNDVGRTLEDAMCIPENNRAGADFLGEKNITEQVESSGAEIKALRDGKLSDNITLMSMSPNETVIWGEDAARKYGTPSSSDGKIAVNAPLKYGKYNSEGLRLMIDDEEIVIEHETDGYVASYNIDAVVEKMLRKLDDMVLVFARTFQVEVEWFHYHHATLYRGVDVDGLLDVIRSGKIVLEPRLEGIGKVDSHHNHGLRWRTTVSEIPTLYDEQQVLVDADMMSVQDARNIEKVQQKMQAVADD